MASAEDVITAIRARGSNAVDLRDAAHEAHHALSSKTLGQWDRENIHRYVRRMRPGEAAVDEIVARLVETMVCEDFGVDPGGTLEVRLGVSCLEAIHFRIPFLDHRDAIKAARIRIGSAEVRAAADAVIALAEQVPRKTKR